ncbi:carboxypeptidase Y inhibitor [Trichomonascus vanleenenianus]|uniref:YbhB/YbcL family Raf kinase inhibitor-like protein n=1 Tax=Trichomonascus vanleenenianus TaxID=2268995 RepID=UPI003ECA91D5
MPLVTIASNISEALKKHEVVPDVVDEFEQGGLLTIAYDHKKTEVAMGNLLKPAETQKRPAVNLTFNEDSAAESTYTLVLTDPDAPTKGDKKWSEYAHYIVSGIKPPSSGTGVGAVDFDKAHELLPYMGPAPPPKTGKHRYVFILYKEPANGTPKSFGGDRPNWGTGVPGSGARDWAKKHHLTPVAINFFYAQNPEQ